MAVWRGLWVGLARWRSRWGSVRRRRRRCRWRLRIRRVRRRLRLRRRRVVVRFGGRGGCRGGRWIPLPVRVALLRVSGRARLPSRRGRRRGAAGAVRRVAGSSVRPAPVTWSRVIRRPPHHRCPRRSRRRPGRRVPSGCRLVSLLLRRRRRRRRGLLLVRCLLALRLLVGWPLRRRCRWPRLLVAPRRPARHPRRCR